MNKRELAKALRVSLPTIDSWMLKGCPYTKNGRGYQFDRKQVEVWRAESMPTKIPASSLSFAEARARKETALAGLRELQLKERQSELVETRWVMNQFFLAQREARNRLQNIPSRVSGLCAAESNQDTIFTLLTKEIYDALESLFNKDETGPAETIAPLPRPR